MFWIAYRDEVREEYPILETLTEESADYLLKHKVRILPYELKVAMDRLRDAEKRSQSAIRRMTHMLRPGLLALLNTENKKEYMGD
ncbi:MAG TPA: hypothetical protein PKL04_00985 [Methanofastidiosum sp.]|nr:hypothetical protein [Methanofastidiosum sp.]